MVSKTEVIEKTDGELLEILANQNDYVAEVVTWVKDEIESRNLDTGGIHVVTVEESEQAAEASSSFAIVRLATFGQGGMGLLLLCIALFASRELLEAPARITSFAVGVLLIVYAVGVWRSKRWAFTSGVIVYTLIAASNMVVTLILTGLAVFESGKLGHAAFTFVFGAIWTGASAGLALMFNALRKRTLLRGA